jgi:cytoskeleton protein RodZ
MTFKATAPTWVEIKDETGDVIISRILVTGESWQTDVDNNVSLSARDSGALELYLGGELMGNLGKKGIPMRNVPMPAVPRQDPPELEAAPIVPVLESPISDAPTQAEPETAVPTSGAPTPPALRNTPAVTPASAPAQEGPAIETPQP